MRYFYQPRYWPYSISETLPKSQNPTITGGNMSLKRATLLSVTLASGLFLTNAFAQAPGAAGGAGGAGAGGAGMPQTMPRRQPTDNTATPNVPAATSSK